MTAPQTGQPSAVVRCAIWALAALILALGLAFTAGGAQLASLGGSLYFLLMGLALLVSGVAMARRRVLGAWVYAAGLLGTTAWALWEVGLDFWPLVSRLPVIAGIGVLVALAYPVLARQSGKAPQTGAARTVAGLLTLACVATIVRAFQPVPVVSAQGITPPELPLPAGSEHADWREWGNTHAGTRFASHDQITKANIHELKVAWTAHTGDVPQSNGFGAEDQATPLQVGDTVYVCTPHNQVLALDADTGAERWRYDSQAKAPSWQRCRGLGYHEDTPVTVGASVAASAVGVAANASQAACNRRILMTTVDARLIALDAATGKPCEGFGEHGQVDLKVGMGQVKPGFYTLTAAPLVARNLIVVGGRVADNVEVGEPAGVVRAFDVRNGKLVWAWDPGNPDPNEVLAPGQAYRRATPNVWTSMAYDDKLGLVYLPTGNTTPDAWGGERTERDDRYSSALVALDLKTGKERWHFQTVHHDLWDYDLPAQPLLYDIPDGKGGFQPALVEVGKTGQIYVLNRETGQPLVDIVEKPVPQGKAKGERYSPTQPFSAMPTIGTQDLDEASMWGATPLDQLWCRINFKKMRFEGPFTPPGEDVSLQWPGSLGGMNWGSTAIDLKSGYLIVNDMRLGLWTRLAPRDTIKGGKAGGTEMGFSSQFGTPYGSYRNRFMSPLGIPCQKPPFGTMSAIDLGSKKMVWQVPVGTVEDTGPLGVKMGLHIPIGMPTLGGALTTKSGLVFFAGTQDYYLRAFDSANGKEIWKARLPVGSQGTPMSYVSPKTGKQYIVVTAGGARQSPDRGDNVIAYALPSK